MAQVITASPPQPRLTVTDHQNGLTIHYEAAVDAMYVAVCTPEYPQRTAFRAIGELRPRFEGSFSEALHKSAERALSRAAGPLMSEVCSRFADAADVDRTISVLRDVDEVRGVMGEAIDSMLATHDNLEVLEDKSIELRHAGSSFARSARSVKSYTRSRHRKLKLACCLIVLLVIVGAVFVLVFSNWQAATSLFSVMDGEAFASPPPPAASGAGSASRRLAGSLDDG